jgi:hypothetical protein
MTVTSGVAIEAGLRWIATVNCSNLKNVSVRGNMKIQGDLKS